MTSFRSFSLPLVVSTMLLWATPVVAQQPTCPPAPRGCHSQTVTIKGDFNEVDVQCVVKNICEIVVQGLSSDDRETLQKTQQSVLDAHRDLERLSQENQARAALDGERDAESERRQGVLKTALDDLEKFSTGIDEQLRRLEKGIRQLPWLVMALGGTATTAGGVACGLVALDKWTDEGCVKVAGTMRCNPKAYDARKASEVWRTVSLALVSVGAATAAFGTWMYFGVGTTNTGALTWNVAGYW